MVMYKEGIPLVPAEEIGYHMGLVVRPEKSKLFFNVRTATLPPPAGYGIQRMPNSAFEKLAIPVTCSVKPAAAFATAHDLLNELGKIEMSDGNAFLCFNVGALNDDDSKNWGHVCVFDRAVDGQIRIIDPSPDHPKWSLVSADKMFNAMQKRGVEISVGVWHVTPKLSNPS
jgi:hypothetical protein